jgi:hypothetical protein
LGETIDQETDEAADIGKNARYQSFEMFLPTTVQQGLILNQPAVDWETGDFFDFIYYDWDQENPLYPTEIARRGAMLTHQTLQKVMDSEYKISAVALFKQGLINSGGPADIMARRFRVSDDFDPAVDNPLDAKNMVCTTWDFADGTNPNYLDGICLDPAINLSANTPTVCEGGDCTVTDPEDSSMFPTVLQWEFTEENLDDQSWENAMDVAKGHRGFLDYDYVNVMFAHAPNWKLNQEGHDNYDLYVRRSFDGGETWTTTPAELGGDGTTFDELFYDGTTETYVLGPGEFEPARNVSTLESILDTVLDPRYSPTGRSILTDGAFLYPEDERDRSKFFVVYETGDNTTTAEGEPTPADLYYSRATEWGDEYYLVTRYSEGQNTYVTEFDTLEHHDPLASEASIVANADGSILYAVWNEWSETIDEETLEELVYDSDAMFARVLFIEDESTSDDVDGGSADNRPDVGDSSNVGSGGSNGNPGKEGPTGK